MKLRFAAILPLLLCAVPAAACGPDALGTSRTMTVKTSGGAAYGLKHFPRTLPLADKEVVLTFDDGPHPGTTERVLEALKRECVLATFFLIGREASNYPSLVQRTAREGHSIANHTQTHPWTIDKLSHADGLKNIEDGARSIQASLGMAGRLSPFMRFPGFVTTPALLQDLANQNVAVFGADLWASDWNPMSPQQQLSLVMSRLKQRRGGIILFHDTHPQTAEMIPAFLRELKANGYKVVHVTR